MQHDILGKYSSAQLRVYTVWFDMLPFDSRARWDGGFLTDPRVVHLWDEQKLTGKWFAANVDHRPPQADGSAPVDWDVYFLYGPTATWNDRPAPLISRGGPIIGAHSKLAASVEPLLAGAAKA